MKVAKRIGLAAALWACGTPLNFAVAQVEPGIYAGVLFGNAAGKGAASDFDALAQDVYASVNTSGDIRNRPNFDDEDSGYGFAVGYRLTSWLAIEGGYVDLGEQSYRETASGRRFFIDENNMPASVPANFSQRLDSSIAGFMLAALGIVPLSYRWETYGRLGIMIGNDEIDISISDDTNGGNARFDTSESATDFMAGVGVSFSLAEIYNLRAEFTRILDAGDDLSGESDIDLLSIGVTVRF
jgi:opacity protein-like surface antigen